MIRFPKVWYVYREKDDILYVVEIPRIFLQDLEQIPTSAGFFGPVYASKPNIFGKIYLLFYECALILRRKK